LEITFGSTFIELRGNESISEIEHVE